jgi:hypothetical protein
MTHAMPLEAIEKPNGAASPGHNKAPLPKAEYIAAIELWTATWRVAEALSADEVRALEAGQKLVAFARAKLIAHARYLRTHPRENAKWGVLDAIFALADADSSKGYCDMVQERFGRFFGRSRKHINDCIRDLDDAELVRVEEMPGGALRIFPIIPRVLAQEGQSVWLFDALAPRIEPAKPGRKRKIPVTAMVTPILSGIGVTEEIPVTAYGDTNFEMGVTEKGNSCNRTRLHYSPYDSPVVETEDPALRARGVGCIEDVLQSSKSSSAVNVTAEHLSRWYQIVSRWGYPPNASIANFPPNRATVDLAFKNAVTLQAKTYSADVAEKALELTLGHMEAVTFDEPTEKSRKGYGPAKTYFAKEFGGTLTRLEREEHERLVAAAVTQERGKIEIDGARAPNEKKLGALDHRLALGNQAATKRIEAGSAAGKMNGQTHPTSAPSDRFNDDDKKAETVEGEWITNRHANKILDGIEGATAEFVRNLLLDAARRPWEKKPSAATVIDWCISRGRTLKLYEVHGTPDKLAGGPPAKSEYGEFRRSLHVSQAFVDRMQSDHPSVDPFRMASIFQGFDFDFKAIGYGAEQQAAFEAAFEGELRKEGERNLVAELRRKAEETIGVSIVDGHVTVCGWLAEEVGRKGGDVALTAIRLANQKRKFADLPVERIVTVVRKIADYAKAGKPIAVCLEAGFLA